VRQRIAHFHMKKTAGTTINNWLNMLVPASNARPADRGERFFPAAKVSSRLVNELLTDTARFHPVIRTECDWDNSHTAHAFVENFALHAECGREARAFWNVLHDHSPSLATADTSLYRFVVLREPISRLTSYVRDWRRLSEEDLRGLPPDAQAICRTAMYDDANTFICRHANDRLLRHMTQTHILMTAAIHGLPRDYLACCDSSPLALAVKALESLFDLVGVVECMDDVVRCIARDVGACPVECLGRWNQGVADARRDLLSEEALFLLRELLADDFELYTKARQMLEARLSPTYSLTDFEANHLESRLQQLTPRFEAGQRWFSLNDQIIGYGLHGREAAETANVTVWSGPNSRTVLYLPVPPRERLDLLVDVGGYIHPSVGDSLRVRVDDQERPVVRTTAIGVLERLIVPVHTTRPWCKLELLVDKTYTPSEAGHCSTDARRLGIALRRYGYALTPTEGVTLRETLVRPLSQAPDSVDKLPTNDAHQDSLWIQGFMKEWLSHVAAEGDPERLIDVMAWDVSPSELTGSPTASHVEHAYKRFHGQPAPQHWLDYWVGRTDLTVRHLYRDLINGDEFKKRIRRIVTEAPARDSIAEGVLWDNTSLAEAKPSETTAGKVCMTRC
jgi:hypothetical protein